MKAYLENESTFRKWNENPTSLSTLFSGVGKIPGWLWKGAEGKAENSRSMAAAENP